VELLIDTVMMVGYLSDQVLPGVAFYLFVFVVGFGFN
jgi:hypothetical protein